MPVQKESVIYMQQAYCAFLRQYELGQVQRVASPSIVAHLASQFDWSNSPDIRSI
jgi:hypothetical protein